MLPTFTPPRLPAALMLLVGVASVGALLGGLHWLGDVLALVVDYYVVLGLIALLVFVRRQAWRWSAAAGVVVLLSSYQLAAYPRVEPATTPGTERDLRVLVYNVYYLNEDIEAAVDAVKQFDADVVFLMEYSDAFQQRIEASFADYPYRLIRPSRFTMGLALFSRIPFESAEVHRFEATRIPVYQVTLKLGDRQFSFVGGHAWPPQLRWGALHRAQVQEITRIAALAPPPLIVAGDFNAAPWSFTLRQLARQAGVLPIRKGLDVTKTFRPIPGFGLPIDHVFVSGEWQVLAQQYGPASGSDHLPMIIDLRMR